MCVLHELISSYQDTLPCLAIYSKTHPLALSCGLHCEEKIPISREQLAFNGHKGKMRSPFYFRQLDLYWIFLIPFACDEKPFGLLEIYITLSPYTAPLLICSQVFENEQQRVPYASFPLENLCLRKQEQQLFKFTAQDSHKVDLAGFCMWVEESNLLACVKFY